jgi:hypothetical protein
MKHTLKSTLVYAAVTMAALLLCLDDFAWPAERTNCYQYLTQEDIFEDSETIFLYMAVDQFVIDTPTDSVLVAFGSCLYKLICDIETSHNKTVFVELINGDWTSSHVKIVDRLKARAMSDPDFVADEFEFDMEEDAFMRGVRYADRGDD